MLRRPPRLPFFPYTTLCRSTVACLFFFNDTATTEIYTLSLHDALPIYGCVPRSPAPRRAAAARVRRRPRGRAKARRPVEPALRSRHGTRAKRRLDWSSGLDRKSTRLNSSHLVISYAVFCLKKKKNRYNHPSQSTYRIPTSQDPDSTARNRVTIDSGLNSSSGMVPLHRARLHYTNA